MAPAHGNGDCDETPADEAALTARLQRLGERLGKHQSGRPSERNSVQGPSADPSALSVGLRLSTEFVAGILVGAAVGWLIDWSIGTSPWGLIVFLLLGFAAGVLNVVRAAGQIQRNRRDPPGSGKQE